MAVVQFAQVKLVIVIQKMKAGKTAMINTTLPESLHLESDNLFASPHCSWY